MTSSFPLFEDDLTWAVLTAHVSDDAPYAVSDLLNVTGVQAVLYDGTVLEAGGGAGVQVVAFPGDAAS